MTPRHESWSWLDASEVIEASELSRVCGLSADEVEELVGYGALRPLSSAEPSRFSAACVAPLRQACKLRQDFDFDLFTVALLVDYLNRIDELERELRSLHAHLPHPLRAQRDGPPPWHEPHGRG